MGFYIVIGVLLLVIVILMIILFNNRKKDVPAKKSFVPGKPEEVGHFYNEQTDNFLKVYGNVIQAFRTIDVNVLLDYQINAIGLKKGMKVLDAGCGVCGPAIYFAEKNRSKY